MKDRNKVVGLAIFTIAISFGLIAILAASVMAQEDMTQVDITSPNNGDIVSSPITIEGKVSPKPKDGEHIWIAVSPEKASSEWWPQNGGPLIPSRNMAIKGLAYFGGKSGDKFRVAVLVVNDDLNTKISNYIQTCINEGDWPPITPSGVTRAEIDASIADEVSLILN
jgi:hypothetical protein